MFLRSFLSKSEVRVRFTPTLIVSINNLAGTDKFAKALANLEAAIKLVTTLKKDLDQGYQLYEIDSTGEQFIVKLELEPVYTDETADFRERITSELENDIIELAETLGLTHEEAGKNKFSKSLPYLQSAVNMAMMLKSSLKEGSQFFLKDPKGELTKIRFIL